MLEIKELTKYYGKNLAVDQVTFTVPNGQVGVLLGPNGSGKSTIIKSIAGLLRYQGEIRIKGIPARQIPAKRKFAYVPEIPNMFDALTVREHIEYVRMAYDSEITDEEIEKILKAFEMDDKQDKLGNELSKGMMQKVSICCALAVKPEFIVCDEPISALDVSIQSQVVNMLEDMQEEMGLTYLFIAHDLSVVRHISHRIGVMYLGTMVELAESYELNRHPLHPYTKTLLSAVPVPDPQVSRSRQRIVLEGDIPSPMNPPSGCRFHTRCPYATEKCKQVVPTFKEYEKGHWVACHLLEE